jgi:hypothetical protein
MIVSQQGAHAPRSPGPVRGKVNGTFTLDTEFDGEENTVPGGVIHFVAGGGGASLYGPAPAKVATDLKKLHGDNFAPFTAKATADKHTFVVLDLSPTSWRCAPSPPTARKSIGSR